jgi:predicted DCC family thiol-disulfide oxidoreductase YuxK
VSDLFRRIRHAEDVTESKSEKPVLYFDGVCGLCNGSVDFLMRIDHRGSLLFSPLQSNFAKTQLPSSLVLELSTVVLHKKGVFYFKSEAIAEAFKSVGGIWSGVGSFIQFFPKKVTDAVYDLVVKYRYSFFGKAESCRLPTEKEKQRFRL